MGTDGRLYGKTYTGGGGDRGTVFVVGDDGTFSILYHLAPEEHGALEFVKSPDGKLYFTTDGGGAFGNGTAFLIALDGSFGVLHHFNVAEGSGYRTLTPASDGHIYGTAIGGGVHGRGAFFRMTVSGDVTVLHSFTGDADGTGPRTPLVEGPDGNFYGTSPTSVLGYENVFKVTRAGHVMVLKSLSTFDGDYSFLSLSRLISGSDGHLYGTAPTGVKGGGTPPNAPALFRMTTAGVYSVVYYFRDADRYLYPDRFWEGPDGHFYGDSSHGLYRITKSGSFEWVYDPDRSTYGWFQAPDGDLYGIERGASDAAVLFRLHYDPCASVLPTRTIVANPAGQTLDITVDGPAGCSWFPTSNVPWLTVLDPGQRTGRHTVRLAVGRNRTLRNRIGALKPGKMTTILITQNRTGERPLDVKRWDYDGDGRTDLGVWRQDTGTWYTRPAAGPASAASAQNWGAGWLDDRPVPGDYDGDRRSDLAVWRPGTGMWHVLLSSTAFQTQIGVQWGAEWADDVPVPADYDGDGRTDIAVWRAGTGSWYVTTSSSHFTAWFSVQWGLGTLGDRPVTGDYDGDGRADIAIWRPSTGVWHVLLSHLSYSRQYSFVRQWGLGSLGDHPLVADYDGDGASDMGVWRSANGWWFLLPSHGGFNPGYAQAITNWGLVGDTPLAGDYDGDGRTDLALWRPSTGEWYIRPTTTGLELKLRWGSGAAGDVPLPR
jgi:uncharacterized repeat protein (TIGR03803 family)